jgi:GT2 family glycosyltransferase
MKKAKFDFSIVIPTYNRPEQLRSCLNSLTRLQYPYRRFEVIVVDDGGDFSVDHVVTQFYGKLHLTLIVQQHGGPSKARNTGAEFAQGKYLAFTDDDCRPAPDWLKSMSLQLVKNPESMIGGRTVNALQDNIFSATSQFIVDIVYAHYNADPNQSRFFSSNNMVICARLFRELGGFDERFAIVACEDRELCDRWLYHGHRMVYSQKAVIYHAHKLTLRKFCRQHFTYGRGAFHYHRLRARRKSGRLYQEMKFHLNLDNWLLRPFKVIQGRQLQSMAILLIFWQLINALGFFYEMLVRKGYRSDPDETRNSDAKQTYT